MNKSDESDGEPGAKTEHKPKEGRERALDVLLIVFTTLTIISGAILSFLGISGGLKSHRGLGLWMLFATIVFALAWAFAYIQKQMWDAENAPAQAVVQETKSATSSKEDTRQPMRGSPMRGLLIPANDPSPEHKCGPVPNNFKTIYFGTGVATMSEERNAFSLIKMAEETVLSMENTPAGILINATIYNQKGQQVATIKKNVFNAKSTSEYEATSPDQHSILVLDSQDNIVLSVRYLNPRAIKILGTFYHPKRPHPIVMEENRLTLGTSTMRDLCIGEIGIWKDQSGIDY